jgi:hypothetical protein
MLAEAVDLDVVRRELHELKARWNPKRKCWQRTVVRDVDADMVVRGLNLSMHSKPTRTRIRAMMEQLGREQEHE